MPLSQPPGLGIKKKNHPKLDFFLHPTHSPLSHNHSLYPYHTMADEVYEGAIGIDLGTTYSCVANYEGTNVEISTFSHEFGTRSRPRLTHPFSCQRAG